MNVLEADNLHLWRGETHVLCGVSFTLAQGRCLTITGVNGAGKTTLLRALIGLIPLEQGSVRWRGRSISDDRQAFCAELRYLGHDNALKADLTAHENLRYWIGLPARLSRDDIDRALDRGGIVGEEARLVRQMSAGQRRRVALARLSLAGGALWVLDEPTSHLDAQGQRYVESLLDAHLQSGGMAIVATHQPLALPESRLQRLELQ
jgi:heme exporter protein A